MIQSAKVCLSQLEKVDLGLGGQSTGAQPPLTACTSSPLPTPSYILNILALLHTGLAKPTLCLPHTCIGAGEYDWRQLSDSAYLSHIKFMSASLR